MRTRLFACLAGLGLAAGAWAQDQVTHFTAPDGTHVTLRVGQPPPDHYGPAPDFAKLDVNRDGYISREEAEAYPPLANDFDYIAHHAARISKAQYERWNQTQNR
jgi:hypothetical protein